MYQRSRKQSNAGNTGNRIIGTIELLGHLQVLQKPFLGLCSMGGIKNGFWDYSPGWLSSRPRQQQLGENRAAQGDPTVENRCTSRISWVPGLSSCTSVSSPVQSHIISGSWLEGLQLPTMVKEWSHGHLSVAPLSSMSLCLIVEQGTTVHSILISLVRYPWAHMLIPCEASGSSNRCSAT